MKKNEMFVCVKRLVFGLIVFFTQGAFSSTYLRPFSEGLLQGDLDISYYKTDSNFNSSGSSQALTNGSSFQLIQYQLGARYNLFDSLALKISSTISQSTSTDALATRNNSILSELSLGADYLLINTEAMYSFIDIQYNQALEKIASDTDAALVSDGASSVHGQIFGVYDLSYFELIGSAGIKYRMEGLSTLMTYSIGAQYGFEDFQLGTVLKGFATVADDSKTNSSERDVINNRVNAGSKKFNSINPNQTDLEIFSVFDIGSAWSLKAYGSYALIGSNTSVGYQVGFSMTFNFDEWVKTSNKKNNNKPKTLKKDSMTKANQGLIHESNEAKKKFKEDTDDGVNQDIFKPVQPSQDTFVKPLEEGDGMIIKEKRNSESNDSDYKVKLIRKKKEVRKKKNPKM